MQGVNDEEEARTGSEVGQVDESSGHANAADNDLSEPLLPSSAASTSVEEGSTTAGNGYDIPPGEIRQ